MICGNDGCDDFKVCVEFLEMNLKNVQTIFVKDYNLVLKNLRMGNNNERIIVLLQGYQQGCLKLS
jgi:hypothetical protein